MSEALERLREYMLRWEMLIVTLLGGAVFASVPLFLGHIGLSWDALNHHFYLGWTAEHPRFDQDYMAASYQAYQFPYLYWPVYRLAIAGVSGQVAGAVLAMLAAVAVPAVWWIAQACVPGQDWFAISMRFAAVTLAFANGVVLSMLDTTANDLLAAIPLIWAVALAVRQLCPKAAPAQGVIRPVWLSGALAGVSVAFKFSNGPLALLMPMLWILCAPDLRGRFAQVVRGCAWTLAGFALAYGYWGWNLWLQFGNPLYPFYEGLFIPLRAWVGWSP